MIMCESGTMKSSEDERNQQQTKCDDIRWDEIRVGKMHSDEMGCYCVREGRNETK